MKTMLFIVLVFTFINTAALIFVFLWLKNLDDLHTKSVNDTLEMAKLFKQDSGSWRAAINIHSTQIARLEHQVYKEEENEDHGI